MTRPFYQTRLLPRLLASTLLWFTLGGATDCNSFNDIVVPENDTTPPTPYSHVFVNGADVADPSFVHVTITNENETAVPINFATDEGGVEDIRGVYAVWVYCREGETTNIILDTRTYAPVSETARHKLPGEPAKNGQYILGPSMIPANHLCPKYGFPNAQVEIMEFQWKTQATDYHGNTLSWHDDGAVTYTPPTARRSRTNRVSYSFVGDGEASSVPWQQPAQR